jgi:hypothetical protein
MLALTSGYQVSVTNLEGAQKNRFIYSHGLIFLSSTSVNDGFDILEAINNWLSYESYWNCEDNSNTNQNRASFFTYVSFGNLLLITLAALLSAPK